MKSDDGYQRFREAARAGGASDAGIEEMIDAMKRENAALDRRVCPKCRAVIDRRIDPRQAGPSELAGTWVNYRCLACRYMTDRVESIDGISS